MRLLILLGLTILLQFGCHRNDSPGLTPPPNSSIPPLYTEISQTCMDRVSIGGSLQVAVRNQADYDSLWYARFQKPLDDYWNQHYASVLSSVKQNHPGLGDSAYAELVRNVFYSVLPFMGTDTCRQPVIDFNEYTLLGQDAHAGGCMVPDYQIAVIRNDIEEELTFKITIVKHGYCSQAIMSNKWILVPQIPESYSVVFQKEYIQE